MADDIDCGWDACIVRNSKNNTDENVLVQEEQGEAVLTVACHCETFSYCADVT